METYDWWHFSSPPFFELGRSCAGINPESKDAWSILAIFIDSPILLEENRSTKFVEY